MQSYIHINSHMYSRMLNGITPYLGLIINTYIKEDKDLGYKQGVEKYMYIRMYVYLCI
jgi:hypothetical protein